MDEREAVRAINVAIASRVPILRRWLEWIADGRLFVGAPVVIVITDQVWRVPLRSAWPGWWPIAP